MVVTVVFLLYWILSMTLNAENLAETPNVVREKDDLTSNLRLVATVPSVRQLPGTTRSQPQLQPSGHLFGRTVMLLSKTYPLVPAGLPGRSSILQLVVTTDRQLLALRRQMHADEQLQRGQQPVAHEQEELESLYLWQTTQA
jgi:hypothetical protein